jgi:hypothetical protein
MSSWTGLCGQEGRRGHAPARSGRSVGAFGPQAQTYSPRRRADRGAGADPKLPTQAAFVTTSV